MADDESQNDEAQLTEEDSSDDTITVRSLNDDKSLRCEVTFTKNFGVDLDDAVSRYGKDVVFTIFHRQAVIGCQGRVRTKLDSGKSKEDAIQVGLDYRPGVVARSPRAAKKDAYTQLAEQMNSGKLSFEELEAQIRAKVLELRAQQTQAQA